MSCIPSLYILNSEFFVLSLNFFVVVVISTMASIWLITGETRGLSFKKIILSSSLLLWLHLLWLIPIYFYLLLFCIYFKSYFYHSETFSYFLFFFPSISLSFLFSFNHMMGIRFFSSLHISSYCHISLCMKDFCLVAIPNPQIAHSNITG